MDLVYEGVVVPVHEPDQLQRIAAANHRKYGWPVTLTPDGAFDAPSVRPQTYQVHALEPVIVRGSEPTIATPLARPAGTLTEPDRTTASRSPSFQMALPGVNRRMQFCSFR